MQVVYLKKFYFLRKVIYTLIIEEGRYKMRIEKENAIVPKLGKTLEELEITKNALAVEAKVRPATVGDLVSGNARSIQFDTLTAILNALNRKSFEKGKVKRYGILDVIDFELIETKETSE